jgi:hypothetical protein
LLSCKTRQAIPVDTVPVLYILMSTVIFTA